MYKMIVLDLDGTLLNDYKEISKENLKQIKRAYDEKGVISVIATGRNLGYVNELCNLYGNYFANYVIACNGAIIKNIEKDEIIHKVDFTNEEVLNFRNIYINEDADYMMLYTDDNAITEAKDKNGLRNSGVSIDKKKTIVHNIEEEIKNNPNLINMLCIIGGSKDVLERVIKKVTIKNDIEPPVICNYIYKDENSTVESKYIDIVKKGCTKKNAIQVLAEKMKINQENIIVIGDGYNDLSMFECAGLKVAMGNAENELKVKADYVTSSNNEDGIAKTIKKYIFNEE